MAEFHDLAELALNRDGQSWGNLGYWQTATGYSDACRDLALLLGTEAALDRQAHLFDAGFGCGDQLLLWLDHFHVAKVGGANLSLSQTEYARSRLGAAGHPETAAAIRQGDINQAAIWTAALDGERPSHVLALDCAYHFPDRERFCRLAQQHLARSGRLALTDFLLCDRHRADGFADKILRWMLKRSHIAERNIVHRQDYQRQLATAGFDKIRMTDISAHVLPGFAAFTRSLRRKPGTRHAGETLSWPTRLKYAVTGRFLDWAYRRSILRYYLVSATKAG